MQIIQGILLEGQLTSNLNSIWHLNCPLLFNRCHRQALVIKKWAYLGGQSSAYYNLLELVVWARKWSALCFSEWIRVYTPLGGGVVHLTHSTFWNHIIRTGKQIRRWIFFKEDECEHWLYLFYTSNIWILEQLQTTSRNWYPQGSDGIKQLNVPTRSQEIRLQAKKKNLFWYLGDLEWSALRICYPTSIALCPV